MPSVKFQPSICSEVTTRPSVTGCDGSTSVSWETLEKPTGSQVQFSDDSIAQPFITVSEDGTYRFKVCCTFSEGVAQVAQGVAPPSLSCPKGVLAGDSATVKINDCENGSIQNIAFTGPALELFFGLDGSGILTTEPDQTGNVSISVDCITYDDEGMPTVTNFACDVKIIDPSLELTCETFTSDEYEFIECGEICECVEVLAVFDCGSTPCDSAEIGLVFKECPECPPDQDCEPIEIQSLVGAQRSVLSPCSNPDPCCDCVYCCDEDQPVLFYNDACTCPGWAVEANAIQGSSVYNACSCSNQKWCFQGQTTIIFSGPPMLINTFMLWGHSMTNAVITTDPLMNFDQTPSFINVVGDDACMTGYTVPLLINFADVPDSIGEVAITITPATDEVICVERMFLGQKFFLPDDALLDTFINPFDGTDYESERIESECGGTLSQSLNHVEVDLEFSVIAKTRWIKERWRSYLRWAKKYGVMFQPSRNNCPSDIFYGRLEGPVSGSSYIALNGNEVVLRAKGYTTQPQPANTVV